MSCLTNLEFTFASAFAAALWAACALILVWVVRNNRFAGKPAFILTFLAMLWWLFTVAFDLASPGETCKVGWSLAAWPGITLLPIAWAFFVFDYTMNTRPGRQPVRLLLYLGLPSLVSIIALTNSQTHLLYGTGTRLVTQGAHRFVFFDHGPLFFAVAAGLYIFVSSALGVLAYAFLRAKKIIRPFLGVLIGITAVPLAGNLAYVVWGVTLFGYDPTPFLFAVALIALSWLLLNNTMMDTAAQGRNLLFYATQDPVIILDAEGRFAGANPAAKALFGKKMPRRGEALDQLEKIGPVLRSFIRTGELGSAEPIRLRGRAFDPRLLPIESPIQTKRPLLGWSVSLVDITEREQSAEALREALARAEAANHAKSQFLAMISHELRTPLTSVKGGLDLALHGAAGEVSPALMTLLTIAQRNSLRLLKLVDDVLDLQKLDLSTITLRLQDLDADAFLRDVMEEYEAYAAETGVRLTITSAQVHRQLRADPDRLKQVVGNVISNAVKFSPEGGQVACSTRLIGSRLRISVQDSGIGIPDNKEDQVFGRFNQVESGSLKVSGGSGLGMHIAKILIERMDGAISYESRLGIGTTFHIDVPLGPQTHAPVTA
ncbi:histidine kinase N-terminal 7TM domain-containing protein [Sinirhodobacter huangdaonensis]|uniref:histidine kinase n=1 Tax=Paenirhodobacter huangdaonensis TaxID=2501515 RepID=A0A3S3M8B3_9RHOB|nr:histidine kinase N-terminal 7TM domain-containing protein [Sinirhodobacter huangdaonensis]RWR50709.1 hybrid sensor histidine kinase/response regulator [Sinirhodobacter huangdaonensis]